MIGKRNAVIAAAIIIIAVSVLAKPIRELFLSERPPPNIIVLLKTNDIRQEFWQTIADGIQVAAIEYEANVDIRGPLSESDSEEQTLLLEEALAEKPDAIVLAAIDQAQFESAWAKARKAGVKLVAMDTVVEDAAVDALVSTDNVEAGRKAGLALARNMGSKAKVVIMNSKVSSEVAFERENGVKEVFASFPEIEIEGTYYYENSEARAQQLMNDIMEKHKDLAGIIALDATATQGAAEAIKERGLTGEVKLVGFDSSIYQIKLLEEGAMLAAVVRKPFNMGYLTMKTTIDLIQGRQANKKLYIDSVVIVKENMYSQENQKILFPFVQR